MVDTRSNSIKPWLAFLSRIEREARYERKFKPEHIRQLESFGVTQELQDRLEILLRVVAYSTENAPKIVDVRKPLTRLSKRARETLAAIDSLLTAPTEQSAYFEARGRFLQTLEALNPNSCAVDPMKPSSDFSNDVDERLEEAKRLRVAVQQLAKVAAEAIERIPVTQSRTTVSAYPIARIYEALNFGYMPTPLRLEEPFPASESDSSPFRQIVGVCYEAAGAPNADPLRAIREFIKSTPNSRQEN